MSDANRCFGWPRCGLKMWLVPSMPTARQSAGDGRPDRLRRARARKTLRSVHRAALPQDPGSVHQWRHVPAQTDTTPRLRIPLCGYMAMACSTLQRLFRQTPQSMESPYAGFPCTVLADVLLARSRHLAQPSIDTAVSDRCAN
jgi:hypothetical protein